jgi:hypothetical protein
MIEAILDGWWKALAVIAGIVIGILAILKGMKKSGVDEASFGPVKIDFENEKEKESEKE